MTHHHVGTLRVGEGFQFPKGFRPYIVASVEADVVYYHKPNSDDLYSCPATHDVVKLDGDLKISKKARKKTVTAKQREKAIKGTTSVNDFKVIEARLAALESGQSQILASLKTQSECLGKQTDALAALLSK